MQMRHITVIYNRGSKTVGQKYNKWARKKVKVGSKINYREKYKCILPIKSAVFVIEKHEN